MALDSLPETALGRYAHALQADPPQEGSMDLTRPRDVVENDVLSTAEAIRREVDESSRTLEEGESSRSDPHEAAIFHRLRTHERLRKHIRNVLTSNEFEWFIGGLIVLNAITIGMEQTWRVEGHKVKWMEVIENLFLVVFTAELSARIFAFGVRALKNSWVFFDFVLVVVSVFVGWILNPVFGNLDSLGFFLVLRTVRLLRLGRTLRLLIHFKELWMLVRGLLGSAYTILYTLLILLVIIYMFASVGIEVITESAKADPLEGDPEFISIVEEHFSSLALFMLTLLQFATLDSVAAIYTPLIKKEPLLVCYFSALVVVLGIVLMNLITAVVVNSALETAMQDKEMVALDEKKRKQKIIQDLSDIFHRLDKDHSGEISRDELGEVVDEDKEMLQKILTITDPLDIFDALDVDENGAVAIEEFCEQLWMAYCFRGSVDIKRTEKKIDSLRALLESWDPCARKAPSRSRTKKATRKWTREMTSSGSMVEARNKPNREVPSGSTDELRLQGQGSKTIPENEEVDGSRVNHTDSGARVVPQVVQDLEMPRWARHLNQSVVGEMRAARQQLLEELECLRLSMDRRFEDRCTAAGLPPTRSLAVPMRLPPPPPGAASEAGAAAAAAKSAAVATPSVNGGQPLMDGVHSTNISGEEAAMKRAVVAQVMATCDRVVSPLPDSATAQAAAIDSDPWAVDSNKGNGETYLQPTSIMPPKALSKARQGSDREQHVPARAAAAPATRR